MEQRASGRLEYSIARVRRNDGGEAVVALVRTDEGIGAAQETANAVIDDLSPPLVLMVGIAGGIPQADGSLTLGDVVISSAGLDVTSGELLLNQRIRSRPRLFELSPTSKKLVDGLRIDMPLVAASAVGVERPTFRGAVAAECPSEWKDRAEAAIQVGAGGVEPEHIRARLATIASGAFFTKDPVVAAPDFRSAVGFPRPSGSDPPVRPSGRRAIRRRGPPEYRRKAPDPPSWTSGVPAQRIGSGSAVLLNTVRPTAPAAGVLQRAAGRLFCPAPTSSDSGYRL